MSELKVSLGSLPPPKLFLRFVQQQLPPYFKTCQIILLNKIIHKQFHSTKEAVPETLQRHSPAPAVDGLWWHLSPSLSVPLLSSGCSAQTRRCWWALSMNQCFLQIQIEAFYVWWRSLYLHKELQSCDSLKREDEEGGKRQTPNTRMFFQFSHGLPKSLIFLSGKKTMV